MKWWCSFLHGLDWLRLIEIENTYLLPGHDNSRHPVRAAGIPLLHSAMILQSRRLLISMLLLPL